jgi:hypothetical protein
MNAKKLAMHMAITGTIVLITSESAQATYPGANGMIGYSYSQRPYDYGSGPTRTVQAMQSDGTGEKNLLQDFYTFCFISN